MGRTYNNGPYQLLPESSDSVSLDSFSKSIVNGVKQVQSNPEVEEPREEDVATLVSMGFPEHLVRRALLQAQNDVARASNILLDG